MMLRFHMTNKNIVKVEEIRAIVGQGILLRAVYNYIDY